MAEAGPVPGPAPGGAGPPHREPPGPAPDGPVPRMWECEGPTRKKVEFPTIMISPYTVNSKSSELKAYYQFHFGKIGWWKHKQNQAFQDFSSLLIYLRTAEF